MERITGNVMAAIAAVLLVVFIGMLVWPMVPAPSAGQLQVHPAAASEQNTARGIVVAVLAQDAGAGEESGGRAYEKVLVRVTTGQRAGQEVIIEEGATAGTLAATPLVRQFRPGDEVYLQWTQGPQGEKVLITDYVRDKPLVIVVMSFVCAVVLIGWRKGLRSLVGTGLSVLVVFLLIVPQIIAGRDPLAVCIVGAIVIATASAYLTFGWNIRAHAASAGIVASLVITDLLASQFVDMTHLLGLGSEETGYLLANFGPGIDFRGLLMGGIIISALGVLVDVCISQTSAVFELASTDPDLSALELFQHGLNIGRDHISASVNTLVLAYAGTALPLFMLFALYEEPLIRRLSREPVSEEIVRSLAGSLGLVLAVPLTTLIAAGAAAWQVQRETGLQAKLLSLLQQRKHWQVGDLAQTLGQSDGAVEAALAELAERGYLKQIPGTCSGDCAHCELRLGCLVSFGGKAWSR